MIAPLTAYDKARVALAEAHRIDEVKAIINQDADPSHFEGPSDENRF